MLKEQKPFYIQTVIHRMIRKPSLMLAALGVYAGVGMMVLGERKLPLSEFLYEYGWTSIGGIMAVISSVFLMSSMTQMRREERFIDVDDKRRSLKDDDTIGVLIHEIEALKRTQPDIDYGKIEALIQKSSETVKKSDDDLVKSFENYFNGIRSTLEEKASIADEKASILLDKGTAYSKWGITFFIISIVVWQALAWIKGFETQFIYGIASCSILFIFIEFLSAWFLKQYRQFVDTSTYLIKVKSIFDKYMLAYLVIKEVPGDNQERLYEMLGLLKEDIKWPESYLLKNGDISFAKETMEAMTFLVKNMKETVKDENKSNK
jgi:hypothetical protein